MTAFAHAWPQTWLQAGKQSMWTYLHDQTHCFGLLPTSFSVSEHRTESNRLGIIRWPCQEGFRLVSACDKQSAQARSERGKQNFLLLVGMSPK